MDSIRIDTGVKRIAINGDPTRVIEFNPKDVLFAEKYYQMVGEFQNKQEDYSTRAEVLEADAEVDEIGLPLNTQERLALFREICDWTKEKIDQVFGAGTSEKAFGEALNFDMFVQFFEGVKPFIEEARSEKVQKYSKVVADRKKIESDKAIMD
jgi:hypothetical protein